MWLVTTGVSAMGATVLNLFLPKRYKFGFLALMLWGATIMILVDHLLGYKGGPFLEKITEGMIESGTLLGIVMLFPILGIWLGSVLITNLKRR
ncbi:MAG: hypothetical protein NC920_03225 [Candidatus Omnitrophica bacterium]|nr:hypothetical protein [Candidatus Omnitrophota bacterium]MCM8798360.1 hypothetical protein [Candidatus Omnitrophota bacterium]